MKPLVAVLVSLLLVLSLAGGGFAVTAELPWKTFSEAVPDAAGSAFAVCPAPEGTGEVFIQRYERDKDAFQFWFAPETSVILFMVFKGNKPGAQADAIGVGKVDSEHNDRIPSLEWMTVEEAMARYPSGPCSALFPAQV